MEKWLLLDGITLNAGDVAPGDLEDPSFVEAHLADAEGTVRYRAAVAARKAADPVPVELLIKLPFASVGSQQFFERSHV